MVILLYSDKAYEYQVINCIKSFESKITEDVKVLYFTIGFDSEFDCKNLHKKKIDRNHLYPSFNFYKAELSLKALEHFSEETYFIFTDADVLFSRRFDFEKMKNNYTYPLASYGPHEYPFIVEWMPDGQVITYDETKLMKYFNVIARSQRYVMSCFYTFNQNCKEFFEEFTSICKNEYLLSRRKEYFPFQDEPAFNICLWKRNVTQNLGYAFVNTHLLDTVKMVEETDIKGLRTKNVLDFVGVEWEYIDDSESVVFYHGIKDKSDMENILSYLLTPIKV